MQQVAQAWLVLQLTHDPLWLGLVAVAQFAPVILFGLFGGVIADHLPKRKTLLVTQIVAMVLAFILFGLTASGIVEVWHVMILAALLGINNAVDMPTRQSFAVEMVGREDMTNAVGLNAAQFNASRIIGPAVAGLLIGAFDISIAFLINGRQLPRGHRGVPGDARERAPTVSSRPTARPPSARVFENLAEGARYVRNTPLVLLGVDGRRAGGDVRDELPGARPAAGRQRPARRRVRLRLPDGGLGRRLDARGARASRSSGGSVRGRSSAGDRARAWLRSSSPCRPHTRCRCSRCSSSGAGAIAMAVTANTTIQMAVPDQLRGRVMSVYTTVFAGSVPAGGLLMGCIASAWGVPAGADGRGVGDARDRHRLGVLAPSDPPRATRRPVGRPIADRVAAGASGESPLTVARRR